MLEDPAEEIAESEHIMALKQKLSQIGIDIGSCGPGQYSGLLCPMCKGGDSNEKSLSLFITQDGHAATWTCFRAKCGWRGGTRAFADVRTAYADMKKFGKVNKRCRQITEESLGLEPLCDVLLAYFSERIISRETLQRNAVMQRRYGDQVYDGISVDDTPRMIHPWVRKGDAIQYSAQLIGFNVRKIPRLSKFYLLD
ncbi:Twinkle -like protein, chloroplastic/mitochondrial [Capsicum baccatum]|uniref:Twinkle-like protein, chloroplastic/mitochondrial n=1 Tax=Capsicum baccatum TaxID=33114 RepID=A0A2G2XBQ5_CAPBA|nr:Twinkle -like protein, chloroplastic/mitochondrial [Capsicum baccatum]